MGFALLIETGLDRLACIHPDENGAIYGNALLSLLTELLIYEKQRSEPPLSDEHTDNAHKWWLRFETLTEKTIFPECKALVRSMWSGGSELIQYTEHDYECYKSRNAPPHPTEEQFIKMIRYLKQCWQPIKEVQIGVRHLLHMFAHPGIETLKDEVDYRKGSIRGLQALDANIALLRQRGNREVRLNFF